MAAPVPVIDLAPARAGGSAGRRAVAAAIDAACREIGFFAIRGHGVPDAVVDALRGKAHAFFARPLAEKLAVATHVIDNSGSLEETRRQVARLWEELQKA